MPRVSEVLHLRATDGPTVVAVVCAGTLSEPWRASVSSLVAAGLPVLLLVDEDVARAEQAFDGRVQVSSASLAEASTALTSEEWDAQLVVTSPVIFPHDPVGPARDLVGGDIRVGTVSYLSNDAGYLSFPGRTDPTDALPEGHDEQTLTDVLRGLRLGQKVVPVPVPAGGAVVVATLALRALGGLDPDAPRADAAVADLALRGVRRGFRNLVDPTTFVRRPWQTGDRDVHATPELREWLESRHAFYPVLHDQERYAPDTPLSDALGLREAAVLGLTVLFDGSCLGAYEMGTQVATLAQIDALANEPRVREVVVGTPQASIPPYAARVLVRAGVRVTDVGECDFPGAGRADILHRPFQPDGPLPFERWRELAHRAVITLQDLIAYDNGSYHPTHYNWLFYRHCMQDAMHQVDAVVAISHDTASSVVHSRLGVPRDALHVIENGTDHLAADPAADARPPEGVIARGAAADRFLLVLGATYSHKNRDLAIRAWQELRDRGHDLQLVLAGHQVPVGSSHDDEAAAVGSGPGPITLAAMTTSERDWLLAHAEVVLYPTSAEGFGLIPFEAATLGAPTVFVGFGPLAEILPDVPVVAREWTPSAVADAVEALVTDAEVARTQVESVLKAGSTFTWAHYAQRLVDVYLHTLAAPIRR